MPTRRTFIKKSSLIGLAGMANPADMLLTNNKPMNTERSKWADGSRLVVSVSMQFEAGGDMRQQHMA